jgi:hypothetical protein
MERVSLFVCSCILLRASAGSQHVNPKPEPAQLQAIGDEFFESYLRWRQACENLRTAYEQWDRCSPAQRMLTFNRYKAALDREEHAAKVHSRLAEQLRALAA